MSKQIVKLNVNGEQVELAVDPNELLLNTLRDDLGLTGTKYACGNGQCGACTVMLDGEPVLSCLTLTASVDGSDVETIEGVADPEEGLHPVQEAFLEEEAVQCGFCTPGMILMGKDLVEKKHDCSEQEIREHIKGNICRCTGYNSIVRAIGKAADQMNTGCRENRKS